MKKIFMGATLALALVFLGACSSNTNGTDNTGSTESATSKTSESTTDLNALELPQLSDTVADDEYLIEMETSEGNIKIKLFPAQAPKAVENFVTHAKDGYYDGTTFHRVIEEFMIQGGDPKGDGTGGESIWGEGFKAEISDQLYNIRGALSMARGSSRSSQGSQFFIVQNDQDMSDGLAIQYYPEKIIEAYKNGGYPSLDGDYSVFGQVIEGMDVVDKIAAGEVEANSSGEASTPVDPATVNKINILQEPTK